MANGDDPHKRPSDEFVVVTKREIYDAVMHLDDSVRELNQAMSALLGEDGPIRDLKQRTRVLELKVWGLLSGMVPTLIVLARIAITPGVFSSG